MYFWGSWNCGVISHRLADLVTFLKRYRSLADNFHFIQKPSDVWGFQPFHPTICPVVSRAYACNGSPPSYVVEDEKRLKRFRLDIGYLLSNWNTRRTLRRIWLSLRTSIFTCTRLWMLQIVNTYFEYRPSSTHQPAESLYFILRRMKYTDDVLASLDIPSYFAFFPK